ncbi:MAG: ABC transporter permease [Acidimicrobiia bacterium]
MSLVERGPGLVPEPVVEEPVAPRSALQGLAARARSARGRWWRGNARLGLALVVPVALYAVVVPWIADPAATRIDPARRFAPPGFWLVDGSQPFFGTDHLGRDLAVTTALGLRTSILIGLGAVVLSALIGWVFGAVTGFLGGRVDSFGSRVMDLFNAFPGLLLVIGLMTALGSSPRNAVLVLALATWVVFGRVARSQALALRGAPFIDGARLSGVTLPGIVAGHVRRNTFPLVGALCVIELPRLILAEATLSFLGFGIQPPTFSLGRVVAEERDYLQLEPWAATFPGVLLALFCVGVALLGMGLRADLSRGVRDR